MSDQWSDLVEESAVGGERQHSRFAPSALKRILTCPRSVALAEALGATGRASIYAAEGSVAHVVAESYLGEGGITAPRVGTIVMHDGYEIVVDSDMHRFGKAYAQYVFSLMEPGDKLYIEQTVRLDAIVGEDANMYGHCDAVIWSPRRRRLIVVDYKYGRGVKVSALDNPQMKAYALGAMFTLADIDPDEVRTVETHVFQPRVSSSTPPDEMHVLDLLEWGHGEVAPTLAMIEADGAISRPYVTGDHCRFCPAKSQCPALRERVLQAAQRAFAEAPLPPSLLSEDEIAEALKEVEIARAWFDAVESEALRRAKAGKTIPGRKLVESRGRRVWKDPMMVGAWMADNGYEPDEFLTERELKSVAQIEKVLSTGDLARQDFKELWTTKSSSQTLAPVSDNRRS
jgi:hypothetical protein